jgi:hypothetical protein
MTVRFRVICMLGLSFVGAEASGAAAQQVSAQDLVYQSARNRVGLLTWCWENGLVDVGDAYKAIKLSGKELTRLSAKASPATIKLGDAAEKEGAAGVVGPNGKRGIDSFARAFRTTPPLLCKEWVSEQLRGADARRVHAAARSAPVPVQEVAATLTPPMPERANASPKRWTPPPMSAYGCRPEEWW